MSKRFLLIAVALLVTALSSAQHRISMGEAKSIAVRRYQGSVVGQPRKNHDTYIVKLRKGNSYCEVFIDARSGRVERATPWTTPRRTKPMARPLLPRRGTPNHKVRGPFFNDSAKHTDHKDKRHVEKAKAPPDSGHHRNSDKPKVHQDHKDHKGR